MRRCQVCGKVIAVDVEQEKLDLALELGAEVALNSKDCDVTEAVKELTNGRGADLAFDVVGITESITTAMNSLRKGGSLTLVGNLSPHIDFPLQTGVLGEFTIRGSCASCGEYPVCLGLLAKGTIDTKSLISAIAPLSEGGEWFDKLYRKEGGLMKVILEP